MSANTETTGADRAGCKAPEWCGYLHGDTSDPRRASYINHRGTAASWGNDKRAYCSPACRDTPPIAAPVARVERRKGQTWRCAWDGQAVEATIIGERSDLGTWPMSNDDYWCDSRWTGRGSIGSRCIMTLLADATPEPEKCEPWCGNGLPPDDVCGYGFIDGPGDEREYFKLPGKSQRRKGYLYSWCSNECREKAEVSTSPPAQEAPKAWGQGSNDGKTWVYCAADYGQCSHRHHRATHEAPKAAPVCDIARDTHAGPVLMRWIKAGRGAKPSLTPACEQCHVLSERAGRFGGVFPASILHDKDVPTRLPRPQLAADWVEDCLPEAGR